MGFYRPERVSGETAWARRGREYGLLSRAVAAPLPGRNHGYASTHYGCVRECASRFDVPILPSFPGYDGESDGNGRGYGPSPGAYAEATFLLLLPVERPQKAPFVAASRNQIDHWKVKAATFRPHALSMASFSFPASTQQSIRLRGWHWLCRWTSYRLLTRISSLPRGEAPHHGFVHV
jgi:hypothetical protein